LFWEEFRVYEKSGDLWLMSQENEPDVEDERFVAAGIRALRDTGIGVKPTTYVLQLLGDWLSERVVELDEGLLEDARDWRSRPWFDDPKSDAVLKGAVDDLLQTPDGEIVVLDYKTRGYPPKEGRRVPHYYERQVNLYNLILAENGYATADFGLLLYYYPDTVNEEGDVMFHREFAKVPTDLEAARELVQEAVRVLDGPEPGPGSECEFCRWEREEHVEEI